MPSLTSEQLHILQHALGLDKYGQGNSHRNHFCAGGGDEPICRQLVEMGYMRVWHPNQSPLPYYNCAVTEEGRTAVLAESPKPPKLTRSQQRYRDYLRAALEYRKDRQAAHQASEVHCPRPDQKQGLGIVCVLSDSVRGLKP